MSKFKERFKDKISVVGRDGVHINVSTGEAVDRQGQPQHHTGGNGNGGKGYSAVPKEVSPKMQNVDVEEMLRDSTPSPQMTDAEWLQQAEAATKQQLLALQKQLGVAQKAPSLSPATTPVSCDDPSEKPHAHVQHGRRRDVATVPPTALPKKIDKTPKQPQPPQPAGVKYGRRSEPTSHPQQQQQQLQQHQQQQQQPPTSERSYVPYTLSDYKLINQPVKLGGLGAEDNEDKKFLRQQKELAKQYAASVKTVNQASTAAGVASKGRPPVAKQPTTQQKAAAERRAKALQFASKVPKPKTVPPKPAESLPLPRIPTAAESEILALEDQHIKDMKAVAEIKKNLGL